MNDDKNWLVPVDDWPLITDMDYCSSELMCDAWIEKTKNGSVWKQKCRSVIYGSTLAEVQANLAQHIAHTDHVPSIWEKLMNPSRRAKSKKDCTYDWYTFPTVLAERHECKLKAPHHLSAHKCKHCKEKKRI